MRPPGRVRRNRLQHRRAYGAILMPDRAPSPWGPILGTVIVMIAVYLVMAWLVRCS